MDIREKTVLIIKKGGKYLVGTILYSTDLRWSLSPWDAWATRTRENAEAVAEKVDGTVMLFNPIVGQIREAKFLGMKTDASVAEHPFQKAGWSARHVKRKRKGDTSRRAEAGSRMTRSWKSSCS